MNSIIQKNRECWVCKTTIGLHCHHIIYGTADRKKSDKYGLTVYLCGIHHNLSNEGVHFNKKLDMQLKQIAQKAFEEKYSHEKFMKVFHRNYL